jgi:hypothetical protein
MMSFIIDDFRVLFGKLPLSAQAQARRSYKLWKQNPFHPSLHFKQVHTTEPLWSVRIGLSWRALGLRENDTVHWFWIGSHTDYDQITKHW